VEVFNEHEKYFPEIPIQPPLRVVSVRLKSPVSVKYVASQIGISLEELQEANYALLDPVWEGRSKIPGGYILRVPVQYKERAEQLALGGREEAQRGGAIRPEATVSASSVYGGVVYTVRRGDTISSIAKHYQTSPAAIKQLNPKLGKTVRVGEKLRVKASESEPAEEVRVPQSTKQNSKKAASKSNEKTVIKKHRVAKGESLFGIAKRYGVSVEQLRQINGLKSSQVTAGRTLIVP